MDWLGTILDQIHELRCPTCGARLEEGTVRGLASEEQKVLVQISCAACGESSIAIIERLDERATEPDLPITRDEVLDVHDFLSEWRGPIDTLLAKAA